MFKKIIFSLFAILLIINVSLFSQNNVVISDKDNQEPHASAILDLISTEKGFLLPRLTSNKRDDIQDPAESLLIYNKDSQCIDVYIDGEWNELWCLDILKLELKSNPLVAGILEGEGHYDEGDIIDVSTTAKGNYIFENWTDESSSVINEDESFQFTMPDNSVTLTANFSIPPCPGTPTVTDIDDNEYPTVLIGDQCWLRKNLRVSRYNDGTEIPTGLSDTEWGDTDEGAYSVWPHEEVEGIDSDEEMAELYGKIYNWYAVVDGRGLCPDGWKVPEKEEFEELIDYIIDNYDDIDEDNVGGALKSCRRIDSPLGGECNVASDDHPRWRSHSTAFGFDMFGFSAISAGNRHHYGNYPVSAGTVCTINTTTPSSAFNYYRFTMRSEYDHIAHSDSNKNYGGIVRCLKESD